MEAAEEQRRSHSHLLQFNAVGEEELARLAAPAPASRRPPTSGDAREGAMARAHTDVHLYASALAGGGAGVGVGGGGAFRRENSARSLHGRAPGAGSDAGSVRSWASVGMGSTDGRKMIVRRVPTSPVELFNIVNPPTSSSIDSIYIGRETGCMSSSWTNGEQGARALAASMGSPIPGRCIVAADTPDGYSCEFGSLRFFLLCALGGGIACGTTHTLIVPLDLVKCRLQVDPVKYRGLIHGLGITVKEEGVRGLAKGWAPTLLGYSVQGLGKFGLYEVFKVLYHDIIGEENAYLYRTWLYLAASASGEFIADIGLSPMEAVKVKIQTTPGYVSTLREAAPMMWADEGLYAFFKSLVPLWMRQIPYTMMKFASFERTLELMYKKIVPKPRAECTKAEQLVVTFAAGYIAGIFCALVSHPADTMVSQLNRDKEATVSSVIKKLGFGGLWMGLGPRIIMIGTLTALQWFIYDGFKVATRLPRPPPPEMPESLKKKLAKKD